jgi:hypothetical protein
VSPRIFLNCVAWALHWHNPWCDLFYGRGPGMDAMFESGVRVPDSSPENESWITVLIGGRRCGKRREAERLALRHASDRDTSNRRANPPSQNENVSD